MMQLMPVGGHKWVPDVSDWDVHRIHDLAMRNSHGYLLEVDLDYLEQLHDLHNELLFLSELMDSKLTNNLLNKQHYVCHIHAFDQALSHELILCSVHRAICFDQMAWMWSYIKFNTAKRAAAKDELEKAF